MLANRSKRIRGTLFAQTAASYPGVLVLAVVLLFSIGCAQQPRLPDLAITYNRAAGHHGPERNPIIAIPGILGTKLVARDDMRVVWGAFDGNAADPENPADARLIALPIQVDRPLSELRDRIEPAGVLESVKISVLGIPVDILAYAQLLATLGVGGYRDEALGLGGAIDYGPGHFTCFQFGYDWCYVSPLNRLSPLRNPVVRQDLAWNIPL